MERLGRLVGSLGRFGPSIGPFIRILGGVLGILVIADRNYDRYTMGFQNQDMEFDFVIGELLERDYY